VTNFGTAAGNCVPRISPSIQPRHCTVECGKASLNRIAVLRSTSWWRKAEKPSRARLMCILKLAPTSAADGSDAARPVAAR
jgi:hypothetical protein